MKKREITVVNLNRNGEPFDITKKLEGENLKLFQSAVIDCVIGARKRKATETA